MKSLSALLAFLVWAVPVMAESQAFIDRFSDRAGHLFKRSDQPMLPGPDVPINFDEPPFITNGLGPNGDYVSYYNFDVQTRVPAPIYVFFKSGAANPVEGQQNVVGVIPGDEGYNDFWNVVKVTVPDDYIANSVRSVDALKAAGFPQETTKVIVNCPIVPLGSIARLRYHNDTDTGLHQGWYQEKVVNYFNFSEKALMITGGGKVPVSPILVTFNKNPNPHDPSSGPVSGFVMEKASLQTHNVVATTPEDFGYSPLWEVSVYDNTAFSSVHDLDSVLRAPRLANKVAEVNCPIVKRSPRTAITQSGIGASDNETKTTATGHQFIRVKGDELSRIGINDVAKFGEAWRDESGAVWGDIAMKDDGTPLFLNQPDADDYCKGLGAELPSGYDESQNGKNGFPNQDSDFVRLAKYLGVQTAAGKGYQPQVLPHLDANGYFWSSSINPNVSFWAYCFDGTDGVVNAFGGIDVARGSVVRCVVRKP